MPNSFMYNNVLVQFLFRNSFSKA